MKKTTKTRKIWIVTLCVAVSFAVGGILYATTWDFSKYEKDTPYTTLERDEWNSLMDELDKLECEECEECEECQSCDCSCSNGMDSPNHNRIVQWRGTDPNSDKGFYTSTGHYTLDGVTNIPTSQDLCGTAKYNYSWSQITFHENLGKEFCAVLNNTDCSTLKTKSDLWIHAGSSWFKTQVTECMQGQYFKFKPLQNGETTLTRYCIGMGDSTNIFNTSRKITKE